MNEQTTGGALYRFHIGLHTKDGAEVSEAQAARALAIFDERYPDGYTLTHAVGSYKGEQEPAAIVEVYAPESLSGSALATLTAQDVRDALDQECVGLAIVPTLGFHLV